MTVKSEHYTGFINQDVEEFNVAKLSHSACDILSESRIRTRYKNSFRNVSRKFSLELINITLEKSSFFLLS